MSKRMRSAVFMAALASLLTPGMASAQGPAGTGDLVAKTELRVCADSASLPFSNEKMEGFENKIAGLIAHSMSLPVKYVWFPQVIGFVRNTLRAGTCDLIMGTVAGDDVVQTTTPYYYTSYVIVYRSDRDLPPNPDHFVDFSNPALKPLHIGVVAGTPPADLLVRHDLMANARPYALTVDTRFESPTHQMISDVASGAIDAGLVWGPIAGYYIHRDHLPLNLKVVENEPGLPRMAYHVAMGVRNNEPEWRRTINAEIVAHQGEITGILRDYGIPLLDEEGHLLP